MANKDKTDDEPPTGERLSWWEEKMLIEAEEHTRYLKTINTAIQIIGLIIILSAILVACNALFLHL